MTDRGRGRPTTYSNEFADRICEAVAQANCGLRKLLDDNPDFPTMLTVQSWLKKHSYFYTAYAHAKGDQLQAMAEDIVDIANDDSLDANDKRIRIDTRKWLLSKLMSKTYGDKLDVTSGGEALAVPSHQIDARIQSIIMQAQRRKDDAYEGLDANALKLLE